MFFFYLLFLTVLIRTLKMASVAPAAFLSGQLSRSSLGSLWTHGRPGVCGFSLGLEAAGHTSVSLGEPVGLCPPTAEDSELVGSLASCLPGAGTEVRWEPGSCLQLSLSFCLRAKRRQNAVSLQEYLISTLKIRFPRTASPQES